jgi:hypothetical protein
VLAFVFAHLASPSQMSSAGRPLALNFLTAVVGDAVYYAA